MNLYLFIYFLCLTYCMNCTLDKDTVLLSETKREIEQFTITNRGSQNALVYIPSSSFYSPDVSEYAINSKASRQIKIRLRSTETISDGQTISMYCYNSNNPNDNQILVIRIVNNYNLCDKNDYEIVESECNKYSVMTISYKYKEGRSCIKTQLPKNETVLCYNKNIQRPSAITLYVFFGIILFLWFYTIYSVKSLYWIYLQYLPPHFIVFYALGTVFISVYEAARTFTSDSANCLVVLIVGAFGHTLHASSAYSTATYMYYEKMKTLKIKNNWLYLALRVSVIMALEFIFFGFAYHYYYGFGRDVDLLSGLTYTIPFCDSNPIFLIYLVPFITCIFTIHFYTLYNIRSQSSTIYVFQLWRIGLACIMLTYYTMEMFTSKELFQGKHRLLFALAVNIAHLFSHGIFYPLGQEMKDENLRPQLATHILTDDIYKECFRLYLNQDGLDNNLSFWEDCQIFKKFTVGYKKRVIPMLKKIIEYYLTKSSNKYIELPNEMKEEIFAFYNGSNPNNVDGSLILDKAILYIYNFLESHFNSFLKSKQSYYVDIPYRFIHDFTYFHPALQYAVRIRMCENVVTDKNTGFAYPMSKGRITNTHSCYQLSDIPQLLGKSFVIRNEIKKENICAAKPIQVQMKHEIGVAGVGAMAVRATDDENELDMQTRENVYMPATCMNNDTGCTTAYGFATIGDAGLSDSSARKGCSGKGSLKMLSAKSSSSGRNAVSPQSFD